MPPPGPVNSTVTLDAAGAFTPVLSCPPAGVHRTVSPLSGALSEQVARARSCAHPPSAAAIARTEVVRRVFDQNER
jgi:hypothetical protein